MKSILIAVLLLLVLLVSYFVRIQTWQKEEARTGQKIFFTLESALLFRYARLSMENKIPLIDKKVEYPDGVNPKEYFSLGGGIVLGKIYKLYRRIYDIDFETFHRYAVPAYFVIFSVLVVFIIGVVLSRDPFLALIMAFWYGVSIPAVIRSTGQEFMRENFALPLIFCHVGAFLLALKNHKKFLFWVSGGFLSLAWCLWDMTHLYIYAMSLYLIFTKLKSSYLIGVFVPLLFVSFLNPYLRFHSAYLSVPIIFMGVLIVCAGFFNTSKPKTNLVSRLLLFVFISLIIMKFTSYGADYGHFSELLLAKLRFLNKKPLDPSKLSFMMRVLWVPALHSPTFLQVAKYFGCILFVGFVSSFLLLYKGEVSSWEKYIIFFASTFSILYMFFFRVHVYVAFFCVLTLVVWCRIKNKKLKMFSLLFLCGLSFLECGRTFAFQEYMGRGVDYKSLGSLIQWLNESVEPESPVLTSFTLAGPIVSYTDCSVVLQPKFEKENSRNKYRDFLTALFSKDESCFYDFATKYGAKYFVYQKGTSWSRSIYSPAYFVAANEAQTKDALVTRFEGSLTALRKFRLVYENFRYKVFKISTPEDILKAEQLFLEGEKHMLSANYIEAEACLKKSVEYYPGFVKTRMRLGSVLWKIDKKDDAYKHWAVASRLNGNM